MKNANANLMKEINLNNVRQVMKRMETATKPQLAALTKLSVVTVNSLVKELQDRGEMVEDEIVPSNGGRPALTYRYNFDYSLALVLYMREKEGQEQITASVVNLEDRVLFKEELVMPVFERQGFYEVMERLLEAYPSIKVIGMGIPGQAVNGIVTVTGHRELTGYRMIEEIESQFGLPVVVENDMNAAISGYCAKQAADEESCTVGIYFPAQYPPGMGIYLDGKIMRGKQGMAGEISFLPTAMLDWHGKLAPEVFLAGACRIIQSVNAVLAPDKVVIYQDRVGATVWESAWKAFLRQTPMAANPEVVQLDTFQEDFEAGMRWLTLKALEPSLLELR
ncbi:ROK family protein [Gorillibacterium sp. CAU 1737]|uniref:ROK family protein n=1 Tax=Gorillibacterium sp. CAU 1737 TaxID=3140362 RepID=UPI003260FFEB